MCLVPRNGFVEEALGLSLLSPQTGAYETNTVDDDEIGIGPRSQPVVELEGDVIGVVGSENLTVGHRRCAFRAAGDDGAILFLDPRLVVDLSACFEGLSLESLVDGVVRGSPFNDAVRNPIGVGLGDHIVGMNQVHRVKGGGFEG